MNVTKKAVIIVGAVLFLSLSANLFLGGLFVGRAFRAHPPAFAGDFSVARMMRDLPEEVRPILRNAMREYRTVISQRRRALIETGQGLPRVLLRDPFDEAAVRKAFDLHRTRRMELQQAMQEAWIKAAAKMPIEIRRTMTSLRPMHARHMYMPMRRQDNREPPPGVSDD